MQYMHKLLILLYDVKQWYFAAYHSSLKSDCHISLIDSQYIHQ